jgi:polyphosphate glucokinase
MEHSPLETKTLAIDIGGSGIKALILDEQGCPVTERLRIPTPQPSKPDAVIAVLSELAQSLRAFERVSVGCPGVVINGVIQTVTPNLDSDWIGFDLATNLSRHWGKPVRVVNDADMQGLGAIAGVGVELVITLGTGLGSALFVDGRLVPNLELGVQELGRGKTYEQQLGKVALERVGRKRWNHRLEKAIAALQQVFNFNQLYIGGGNATKITFDLPANVKAVPNVTALLGGIALWRDPKL